MDLGVYDGANRVKGAERPLGINVVFIMESIEDLLTSVRFAASFRRWPWVTIPC